MNSVKQFLSRRRLYSDLSQEIQEHIGEKIDELVASGMSRKEATHAARRDFGNATQIEERGREVWQWPSMENVLMDVRYGLRQLRRNPGFTAVAIATLALGIGANTAIFSALNATTLSALPYKNPQELVMLWGVNPRAHTRHGEVGFSAPNFLDFKDQNQVFENMGTFRSTSFTLTGTGNAEFLRAGSVTSDFFKVLEGQPALGRTFLPEEDAAGTTRWC